MNEDVTYYDEDTLFKVRAALHEALDAEGVAWDHLLDACVNEMQNAGILFRERGEGDRPADNGQCAFTHRCLLDANHHGEHLVPNPRPRAEWTEPTAGASPVVSTAAETYGMTIRWTRGQGPSFVGTCDCGWTTSRLRPERLAEDWVAHGGECVRWAEIAAGRAPAGATGSTTEPPEIDLQKIPMDQHPAGCECTLHILARRGCALSHPHAATKRCPG